MMRHAISEQIRVAIQALELLPVHMNTAVLPLMAVLELAPRHREP